MCWLRSDCQFYWGTYVIATFERPFHVLVHVVVVERHEERIYDDTQRDKQLDERVEHQ